MSIDVVSSSDCLELVGYGAVTRTMGILGSTSIKMIVQHFFEEETYSYCVSR